MNGIYTNDELDKTIIDLLKRFDNAVNPFFSEKPKEDFSFNIKEEGAENYVSYHSRCDQTLYSLKYENEPYTEVSHNYRFDKNSTSTLVERIIIYRGYDKLDRELLNIDYNLTTKLVNSSNKYNAIIDDSTKETIINELEKAILIARRVTEKKLCESSPNNPIDSDPKIL